MSAFAMLRRVLPILLGAQTAGFAVAIVSAGLFEAGGLWLADRVSVGEVKLLLSVILLGGVAIYAAVAAIRGLRRAFALFTPEPLDVLGRAVDETQAASLWRFTRELARRQEALEPDHVVVGLTEGFFVTSADVRLWPEERVLTGRTLYVPAPALALLNGREVAAIIGHELAHFSGEDTLYSQRFAPIYAGFERALAALSRNQAGNVFVLWPAIALGALTLYAFDTAVARWRREREFEADRRGSVVSGPDAAASALVRTAVAAPIIHAVLEGAADAPERADADLVAAVAAAAAREGFETPQAHLDDRQPHPTDSHPPIRQRLAALQVAPDHPLLARATRPVGDEERAFAPALFADWPALCGDLSRDLLGRMREHDAAVRTVLERTIAAGPAEETPLFENTGPVIWTFGIMAALLTAAAAATVVFAAPLGLSTNPVVQSAVAAGLLAAALGLVAYAWAVHRRRHEPYLVLTPEGFRSPLLQAPIAWTSVADCRISHDRRLALTVALAPDAPLPAKTRRALKARVSSRRREVTIESAGVRGLKPQAYAQNS